VREWRAVIIQFKEVLAAGGLLLLTTRSRGFPYHGFPDDFWRYEVSDFESIFSDLDCNLIAPDPSAPGVFLKARKPPSFEMRDIDAHALFSVVTNRVSLDVTDRDISSARARRRRQQIIRAPERLVRRIRDRLLS
jgi:hypothetical protein